MMKVGAHTYHAQNITALFGMADLTVGKYCSIGDRITVMLGGNHRVDWISTFPFSIISWEDLGPIPNINATKGDVIIGNDVWLGQDTFILSGVTIGDGAVIGARSVVTKSVGAYEIWAGNPARFRKERFTQADKDFLMRLKWWDWPDERVHRAAKILMSGDFAALRVFAESEGLHV